jgi:hypothetical protein
MGVIVVVLLLLLLLVVEFKVFTCLHPRKVLQLSLASA